MRPKLTSQLFFQTASVSESFTVNLDIAFPKVPCDLIAVNYHDQLNYSERDYEGKLNKLRTSKDGEVLSAESHNDRLQERNIIRARVEQELADRQGCRFQGSLELARVSG